MNDKLVAKIRNIVTVMLAILLAVSTGAAFVLSYDHIAIWALSHGFIYILAWVFPAFVDIVTIAAELSILLMFLVGATTRQRIIPWCVVILFFFVSVAMQVGTSPNDLATQMTLAMPPIAVALLVTLAMVVVEVLIQKGTLTEKKEIPAEKPLKAIEPVKEKTVKKQSNKERIHAILDEEGKENFTGTKGAKALAARIGVSDRTAYRAVKEYENA